MNAVVTGADWDDGAREGLRMRANLPKHELCFGALSPVRRAVRQGRAQGAGCPRPVMAEANILYFQVVRP